MVSKVLKKVTLLMILIIALLSFYHNVNAATLSEMESKANAFISAGSSGTSINYENVTKEFVDLGKILTMIGSGVMVAVVTYMGIKYLTAGPEAQAKLKTQLIGVVVAGVVIFGAYNVWSLVLRIASQF